jgi:hypothetical protein
MLSKAPRKPKAVSKANFLGVIWVAGLLGLILVSAGCGSSNEATGDSGSPTVAKVFFIKRADQICEDNYDKRGALLVRLHNELFKGNKPPPQAKQEEILVQQIMPIFREESDELNDLPLPQEETEKATQILRSLEQSIESVEASPAQSLRNGTAVAFHNTEQLAQAFGFEWCGRS